MFTHKTAKRSLRSRVAGFAIAGAFAAGSVAGVAALSAPANADIHGGNLGGDSGLVNVSHNNVPIQVCNDRVTPNVLGVQVPVDDVAGALGLLSPGSYTNATNTNACAQGGEQSN